MDPNLYSEQAGLTPDTRKSDEGASYLRLLKTQPNGADLASAPSTDPRPQASYSGQERRRSPRFRCSGSVEFKPEGSEIRMWGTLTDVSLHGCYVEMSTTFPVGTKVELALEALGIRVRAQGTVRVSYPFLGMGICLTDLEPGQQTQLEQLLSAVAGQSAAPDPALARDTACQDITGATEPAAFFEEIRRFFVHQPLLSRQEFFRIVQRCRRSQI